MTTVKFEIVSERFGLFDDNSLPNVDQRLRNYVTRDRYSNIIWKINRQINQYKSKTARRWTIGLAIIIINAILLFIILIRYFSKQTITETFKDSDWFLGLLIYLFGLLCCLSFCCIVSDRSSGERKNKCFRKLQSGIQTIADKGFMSIHQISCCKWSIQEIDNRELGKRFKLTAQFHLPQPRVLVPSVREPIDGTSIRLDPPSTISTASAFRIDLEQVTTPLNNEQYFQYAIAPATRPPPSYYNATYLFSQETFTDCPICGIQKGVFDSKYCTHCGYLFLV